MSIGEWFRRLIEAILLFFVVASPWFFGSAEPIPRGMILIGIAGVSLLAGLAWYLGVCPPPRACSLTIVLFLLVCLTALQLVPIPPSLQQLLSPELVRLRTDLLPSEREVFEGQELPLNPEPPSWQPLSLCPSATRVFLIDLLAVFAVFTATRFLVASPSALRRLAWTCLFVGASLSIFAILQQQSSPDDQLYWTYRVPYRVFGPFVNRNHFPDFAALCLGAGVILFARWPRRKTPWTAVYEMTGPPPPWSDGRLMWLAFLSASILTACFFSMSRGGIVAIFGSTIITATLILTTRRRLPLRLGAVVLGLLFVFLLALSLGTIPIESRIASIWKGDDWSKRAQIWRDVVPHLKAFAAIGSGGGTFEFVEPMYSTVPPRGEVKISEHAHNEYVEAAFEGGIPRFILTVVLASLPTGIALFRLRSNDRRSDTLVGALGLVWGLNVLGLHSIVEFGIHVPAVALLAAISLGHLSYLGKTRGPHAKVATARISRWASCLAAWALVPVFCLEGITSGLAEHYRQAALDWASADDEDHLRRSVEYWKAAVKLRPDDPLLHQRAGQAYLDLYNSVADEEKKAVLELGLQHLVASRDLCPTLAHPHARLGEWRNRLARGDDVFRYFERAVRVLPDEPESWFGLGRAYLLADRHEQAQATWSIYLTRSRKRLPAILRLGAEAWGEPTLRATVLPPVPEVWREAATILHPDPADHDGRRPYLEQASRIFAAKSDLTAQNWYDWAAIQAELGQIDDAVASYRQAIQAEPAWRSPYHALVSLFRRNQRYTEARELLREWQSRFPNDPAVANLLRVVEREILLNEP